MVKWKLVLSFVLTIFIPLLYLFNIAIAIQTPNGFITTLPLFYLGVIITLLGVIVWIISYVNLGFSFGVLPKKQKKVTKGLYKYTNHPMYIAIYLTFLGLSITNSSWQSLIFLNVVIVPLLFVRAYFEEKNLIK